MKFSLNWLQNYIDLHVPTEVMLEKLTLAGTEVEHVATTGLSNAKLVVARIVSSIQHPNADRLRVCQVEDGIGVRQIVCGAKNFKDGDKAPLALPGAVLPGGLTIKESKLRGELSQGMLCSAKELALAEDAEGLLILPADAPVGKLLSAYLPGDTIFEVEITSNRPDLLSYKGMAREIAATGAGTVKPVVRETLPEPETSSPWRVEIAASDLGPLYSATHLTGVKVGPSPRWLQEAIAATGHRPINNVVDITNYVLFETGQPLHAFDADKLSGQMIEVHRARAGEKLEALDDKTYELRADDLVIADEKGPVAIAGVMGGKPTAVTESTTEVLLEAAWFFPHTVRRTSRRLGLISDSSYRYERRVDPAGVAEARLRALHLLIELTGAKIASAGAFAGVAPEGHGAITLRNRKIEELLGVAIAADVVDLKLTQLGLKKIPSTVNNETRWQPPSFRHDLHREVDLIEEIARLQGLEGVPGRVVTKLQPESTADRAHDRLLKIRRALATRGWDECLTDALVETGFAQVEGALSLENPMTEMQTHLRASLKSSLLQVASKNLARGVPQVRLFEVGRVYQKAERATHEPLRMGLLVAGLGAAASWNAPERASDYFDLTGVTDFLRKHAGIEAGDILESSVLTAAELRAHGIKVPVFYAEISLEDWLKRESKPERYAAVVAYPSVRRDLAVVVLKTVPHARVEEVILQAKAPQMVSAHLFDLFTDSKGEKISADQKSLAYALTYRAPDRTLTEKEVNAAHELVRKKLATELACTFRE